MSKRLTLNTLGSPRCLRSGKEIIKTISNSSSETSQYFDNQNNVMIQPKIKNRAHVVIKHEKSKEDYVKSISENAKWVPAEWQIVLNNIKEMRKQHTSPVDEMGCHKCADPDASDVVSRFQFLLSLMLSSQTKDQVTYAAMTRLKAYGCTPDKIAAMSDDTLGKLIYPVGFWKRKAGYIKRTAQIIIDQYGGDIPGTIEELCKLPGVGPKMGHICMQIAWKKVSGIGVDTHVHRISNRLGWVKRPTKTPEETRVELEDWLPKCFWSEVNHLLVGFGQVICLPRYPKCTECLNINLCPYAKKDSTK